MLLEVTDLRVRLGAREVLRGVDLAVAPGEIVGVIGETGSGKTTLARTIAGLERASRGRIVFDGRDLGALRGRRLRAFRRGGALQLVFQDPLRALDPAQRVAEIVGEGPAIRGEVADVEGALALVGLPAELLGRVPRELSGGQRQRVAIARALVARPRLVLLDEPVSALDAATRGAVLRMLARLRDELGVALLVISHDLSSLAGIADRVVVLYDGEVVEAGPTARVLAAPAHEYTRLLLAAAVSPARERRLLTAP